MTEPRKGDTINEGIMKEITGEDEIQARHLHQEAFVFVPQFTLCCMTNYLFAIKSNDDGTWRRIRVVEHLSKFTDNPYNDSRFPKEEYPYQFPIDRKIDEKNEKIDRNLIRYLTVKVKKFDLEENYFSKAEKNETPKYNEKK